MSTKKLTFIHHNINNSLELYLILKRRQCFLILLKLFKLTLLSYVKQMKKIYFYKKVSLFNCVDSYFGSYYHRLCSYCDSIKELKSNKQRWGRWWFYAKALKSYSSFKERWWIMKKKMKISKGITWNIKKKKKKKKRIPEKNKQKWKRDNYKRIIKRGVGKAK